MNVHNVELKQLFGYSQSIVDGMEYLTPIKIIHRNLAARNILVDDQETDKISDFGLARQATNNDFYVMTSTTNIPVRWEAIECLTHRKYSHKSDVFTCMEYDSAALAAEKKIQASGENLSDKETNAEATACILITTLLYYGYRH